MSKRSDVKVSPVCAIARSSRAMASQRGSSSTRGKEFRELDDALIPDFDYVDQLGGHGDAGNLGINIRAPVGDDAWRLGRETQQLVIRNAEHLDQHRQPGAKLGQAL